jgi:hypothetical protein
MDSLDVVIMLSNPDSASNDTAHNDAGKELWHYSIDDSTARDGYTLGFDALNNLRKIAVIRGTDVVLWSGNIETDDGVEVLGHVNPDGTVELLQDTNEGTN